MVFRADASSRIGHGHVVRCLTLADALRDAGAHAAFVSRDDDGNLHHEIERQGHSLHRLAPTPATGLDQHGDAEETLAAVRGGPAPDWMIVDSYGLGEPWEQAVRPAVRRVMVIDDLADRRHDCDLLLDQNLVAGLSTRYDRLVPPGCARALGPRYALLQPQYAELHDRLAPRRGPIRRILITFGGADTDDLAGRTLSAFLGLARDDVRVDVIAGASNADRLRQLARGQAAIFVHAALPSLAPFIADADLAIGACGVTSWERMCLGLQAIVITVADNQRPIASELHERGFVEWLGDRQDVSDDQIRTALASWLERGANESVSREAAEIVDGRGARRVAAALLAEPTSALTVRDVTPADSELLLEWANDSQTRQNGFSPAPISAETHRRWFAARLADGNACRFFVVESSGEPIGQVRFQQMDGRAWEVHYGLSPVFRGRGLGGPFLRAALCRFRDESPDAEIEGRVKPANIASCRIFESLGFTRRSSADASVVAYRREMRDMECR